MKKNLFAQLSFASLALMLFSCSSMHDMGLSQKRYSHNWVKKSSSAAETKAVIPVKEETAAAVSEVQPQADISTAPAEPVVQETFTNTEIYAEASAAPGNITAPAAKSTLKSSYSAASVDKNTTVKDNTNTIAEKPAAIAKKVKKARKSPNDRLLLEVILSLLIPPLAVYLHEGAIGTNFWIDLILTLIFFVPGVIFALLVVTDVIRRS